MKKPVHVKGTVQLDGREAQAFEVTEAKVWLTIGATIASFKPSERPKSVTLRILSVQAQGSELRFG